MHTLTSSNTITVGHNPNMIHSIPVLYYGRILLGEITPLIYAIKRVTPRWSSSQQDNEKDPLVHQLRELQSKITHLKSEEYVDPLTFLEPFLAVIRSEDTTGPVTKSALAAVNRMLNYGLIDVNHPTAGAAVEAIATAVTHARFVGTDQGADEVVLWEILTVLRTLLLGPVGHLLTNESVCEILNSSFRICFETRLSELLRNCTEDALRHMVQLLFSRLPQFKDDPEGSRKLKLRTRLGSESKATKALSPRMSPTQESSQKEEVPDIEESVEITESLSPIPANIPDCPALESEIDHSKLDSIIESTDNCSAQQGDIAGSIAESTHLDVEEESVPQTSTATSLDISHTHLAPENSDVPPISSDLNTTSTTNNQESNLITPLDVDKSDYTTSNTDQADSRVSPSNQEFTNLQGVKFTQNKGRLASEKTVPYGLPCVRESFRFLISLTSSLLDQGSHNMVVTALNLLAVALEVGVERINQIPSLLKLVKNHLCRNLLMLIKVEAKPVIFMASLRVCTLIFDSLRPHLKFQLEMFINKLIDIVTNESSNISYTYKELALETIVQLWRIPGFITELFLNFDCNLYSSNIFEDLTKVLSKNAFPVQGLYSTNLLSLEALLTAVEFIDSNCRANTKKKPKKSGDIKNSTDGDDSIACPAIVVPVSSGYFLGLGLLGGYAPLTPALKARSCIQGERVLDRDALLAVKGKKIVLMLGTDQFNAKPDKGIHFLQENGLIGRTNEDIAIFLRDNPHLDKKIIGEFVSKKKNVAILSAFVKSFNFQNLRIDECLRMFLEAFRLPGEAPLISIIIEHFSSHWHLSNGEPFEKDDAAFTLAYAVIMLNVDQHNQNAKKQNIPMTLDQFRNNLRGVNNGKDFDQKMLEEIYNAIHHEEIVMPAEQTGILKENYLWKLLLKRGNSKDGDFLLTKKGSGQFDKDLFSICWGPTIASLSYVLDKSAEECFIQRAITGYKRCASISARYGMNEVFDNLVISLCKFTTLTVSSAELSDQISVQFGSNAKAQLATKTVFRLVILHGDILREGWKNILELFMQLFRYRLLPPSLTESEDFVEASGSVSLVKSTPLTLPRAESGLFSSLYSYIALGDSGNSKTLSPEDTEKVERAKACIVECHLEKIITESAFLRYDSLCELLRSVMGAGDANNMVELATLSPSGRKSPTTVANDQPPGLDEYEQSYLLELVVSILVANKDRAGGIWPSIRDHIYSLLMGAVAVEKQFLLERCIVAVLRVAKVLLRRPELANPILQSLRMLLLLRPHVLNRASLQVISGIHEVLSLNADHIQDSNDWAILFALLECCGAGAKPPPIVNPETPQEQSLSSKGCKNETLTSGVDSGHFTESGSVGPSDDENSVTSPGKLNVGDKTSVKQNPQPLTEGTAASESVGEKSPSLNSKQSRGTSPETIQNAGGWILVGKEGEIEPVPVKGITFNEYDIVHQRVLEDHKPEALVKAVDTLVFMVREHHVTTASLPFIVQACRTFVEATLHGVKHYEKRVGSRENLKSPKTVRKTLPGNKAKEDRVSSGGKRNKSPRCPSAINEYDADESDTEELPTAYHQISEKLLDLMDTLHTSSSHILNLTPDEQPSLGALNPGCLNAQVSLWHQSLCPLLQGIARYCCDSRIAIRNLAMTYLQRALLNHDLQTLSAAEWEGCFNKVLFPLLSKLLQSPDKDFTSNAQMEETRVRAATLVQKVYLRHLTSLLCLPTFTALWLTILDFMDKYLNIHKSDHLSDAIPEILKNMLLVMETTQVFHTSDGFTQLWGITWDRIDAFLPHFRHDLFKSHPPSEIHRIEVAPSNFGGSSPISQGHFSQSGASSEGEMKEKALSNDTALSLGPEEGAADAHESHHSSPLLKDQHVVSLSLSDEDLPSSLEGKIVLRPPLPSFAPPGPPIPPFLTEPSSTLAKPLSSHLNLSTEPATLINQDLCSNLSTLSLQHVDTSSNEVVTSVPNDACSKNTYGSLHLPTLNCSQEQVVASPLENFPNVPSFGLNIPYDLPTFSSAHTQIPRSGVFVPGDHFHSFTPVEGSYNTPQTPNSPQSYFYNNPNLVTSPDYSPYYNQAYSAPTEVFVHSDGSFPTSPVLSPGHFSDSNAYSVATQSTNSASFSTEISSSHPPFADKGLCPPAACPEIPSEIPRADDPADMC